jgi:hypothetical protein
MTTTQRGYGWTHQQRRDALIPYAIGTRCPLCNTTMTLTDKLALDHSTPLIYNPTSVGDRIVHAHCNEGRGRGGTPRREAKREAPDPASQARTDLPWDGIGGVR